MAELYAESRYDLEMAFSRGGLHTGWLRGNDNQRLVHAHFGTKRGVFLGEVARIEGRKVTVALKGPLKPGDGVVFDAGHPEEKEEGGRVYEIQTRGRESLLGFGNGVLNFRRIRPGDKIWKTSDPELERRLRQTFAGDQAHIQQPIGMEVSGKAREPLRLVVRDSSGHEIRNNSKSLLAHAEKHPMTTDWLREKLGRLGGTGFRLENARKCAV